MDTEFWTRHLRRWGVARTAYALGMGALRRLLGFELHLVYLRPLDPDAESNPAGDVEYRVLRADELEQLAGRPEYDMTAEFVRGALARGDICVGAFRTGELLAYVWRAMSGEPHTDRIWVEFARFIRHAYKSFTLPQHRGQHLQTPIAKVTDRMFFERGFTHELSLVETHNFASIRAERRKGHRCVGYAGYVRLAGRFASFRSPGAKRQGTRFFVSDGK